MNGPFDNALRRQQLERFARFCQEKRRRDEKRLHCTRGHRDDDGAWVGGLLAFMRYFWHILEPGKKMTEGWVLEAIAEHLEAVAYGEIKRLLITVPPGCSKSLMTDVFFPAWLWASGKPELRFLAFSYSSDLTERDNGRFRDLLLSQEFKDMYGSVFSLKKIGEVQISNDKQGWKRASSVGGLGTGARSDGIVIDDPHSIKTVESEDVRNETIRWFKEVLQDRLNDMSIGWIIAIMQRSHMADVAGTILDDDDHMGYVHLNIAMEFIWSADDDGNPFPTEIGWVDPRWTPDPNECEGALMWPERFPVEVVEALKRDKGDYAYTAQYMQMPVPRGGSIIKTEYWQDWQGKFPSFSYIFASLDGAFSEEDKNDPSAMTVWGIFENDVGHPRLMLIFAWQKWLAFEGQKFRMEPDENQQEYMSRQMREWGLVEWCAHTAQHWRVDHVLIENKASGISVGQALEKRYMNKRWSVQLIDPKGENKTSRTHAVQPCFSQHMVYAPLEKQWAQDVIYQCGNFPFDKHDDLHDSVTQAVKHARDAGLLEFDEDLRAAEIDAARLDTIKAKSSNKLRNYMPGTT
jgi:predicted phage terminase large subunit-like protein